MRERPRLRVPPDGSLALVEPERLLPEALAGLVKADPEGGGVLELPAELARADRLVAARADLRRARDEADARGIRVDPRARPRRERARQLAVAELLADPRRPAVLDGRHDLLAGLHERVAKIGRRDERLLDRPRAHPTEEVHEAPRLVVRPRRARAAKGLLANDGTRRLIVDVEVAGRVGQRLRQPGERRAIPREDRAGERGGRAPVAERQRLVAPGVLE